MDDIIKQQQEDRQKGTLELRVERDSFRTTLRDQFAMSVIQGIMANDCPVYTKDGRVCSKACDYAAVAYVFADAMLVAREAHDEQD
jgi:hypothetical protein